MNLVTALMNVYNMSLPLALFLAIPAFIQAGKLGRSTGSWGYTLDLADLAKISRFSIAHYAAFVHPNHPSHSPDPELLKDFVGYAQEKNGLNLNDLAAMRVQRESILNRELGPGKMGTLHEQVALGESSLAWLIMGQREGEEDKIPVSRIRQWFGEERLPDGWWQGGKPSKTIGLIQARSNAGKVQKKMKEIRHASGVRPAA